MNRRTTAKPKLLKNLNRRLAFDILQSAHSISRPELAERTGLSRATISLLADELLETGLAVESGLADSSGGRPPVILRFDPDAAYAVGACMHEYDWNIVVVNLDARVLRRHRIHIQPGTPTASVAALSDGLQTISEGISEKILPAIGLGTPGLVDIRNGVIKLAADIGWVDVPFRRLVEDATGIETYIANRSKVGALAEYWYGTRKGVKDLIYVSIGTGVAAGIIHQGSLLVGANSSAGEVGHLTIVPDGPLCPCGNRGCLQQLVSEEAIANLARQRLRKTQGGILKSKSGHHPELITARDVFYAAERGDAAALETLDEIATYLGIALAGLINLFNPEVIFLGGPVGEASAVLEEKIREKVQQRAMSFPLSAVQIQRSSLGTDAGAIGASVLVLQKANELFFRRTTPARPAAKADVRCRR
ncbi:MAG: ROK family protein [Spirochaetales bacterium]|nr:ROK family protein [Spirochaetales bacterium]